MKNILLVLLLFMQFSTYAQNKKLKDNFSEQVREEEGDLNKDGRADRVVVMMDTSDSTVPLRLQIFFAQPNKKFRLVVSSTRLIEPQYPAHKKGKHNGYQIPDFSIEKGILIMRSEVRDGHAEHHFKLRNGNFELIFVSIFNYNGKNTTMVKNFNLITGERYEKSQLLGSDKFLIKNKFNTMIRPLPKLQNFKPFEKEFY